MKSPLQKHPKNVIIRDVFIQKKRLATTSVAGKYKYRSLGEVSERSLFNNLKYIIRFFIYAVIVILAMYFIGNTTTVRAEDRVILRTLESEVKRLSVKYKVEEKTILAVIKCESELYGSAINHNLDKDGNVWSTDWGYLQINDYFHKKPMDKLGLDITNPFDSLEYGVMMMSRDGLGAWKASRTCWISKI